MTPLVTLGVDPGLSGALALCIDGDLFDVTDMPAIDKRVNGTLIADWLDDLAPHLTAIAAIEQVASRPGQGVASSFRFGHSAGVAEGVLTALRIPIRMVTPPTWKKHHRLIGADKDASRARACELWPTWAQSFKRVKDDGRAEAALIARWAWEVTR
jgi:crossover junction endodeoxyribonuclease RuvC